MMTYIIRVRYVYNMFDTYDKYAEVKLKVDRQLSQSDIEKAVLERLYGAQVIKEMQYEIEHQ